MTGMKAMRTRKLGRNAPCSCGSGLKFKKCCLRKEQAISDRVLVSKDLSVWTPLKEAPPEVRAKAIHKFQERARKEQDRKDRFGQIRPQISAVGQGQRWVAVANRVYYSDKWKLFPDF